MRKQMKSLAFGLIAVAPVASQYQQDTWRRSPKRAPKAVRRHARTREVCLLSP